VKTIKLRSEDLQVGIKLPWPIFDADGKQLLQKDHVITPEDQIAALVEHGVFRSDEAAEPQGETRANRQLTPFELFYEFTGRIKSLLVQIEQKDGGAGEQITKLSGDIRELCDREPDAALATVCLCNDPPYTLCHPIHVAILSALVAKRMEYSADKRTTIIAAALTSNVSMRKLQDLLCQQKAPLTPEQRAQIAAHPDQSVSMLKEAGVTDDFWLSLVKQHHERIDGSGYPSSLKGDAIAMEALILGMADAFSAMVSERAYRSAVPAKDALRDFFVSRGKQFHESLAVVFIKELGVYPPGIFVQLENGERGVVIKRASDGSVYPTVSSYLLPGGTLRTQPLLHNADKKKIAIKSTCAADPRVSSMLNKLWGFA